MRQIRVGTAGQSKFIVSTTWSLDLAEFHRQVRSSSAAKSGLNEGIELNTGAGLWDPLTQGVVAQCQGPGRRGAE